MRVVVKFFWMLTVVVLVSFALMISLARLALPVLGEYKQDIEVLLEEHFEQSLSIGVINAKISGFSPSLQLLNVSMLDKATDEPLLFFNEVHVDINILKSLLNWQPELENLTVVGLDLMVERSEQGQIVVAGVRGGAKRNLANEHELARQWLLHQGGVRLEQATIRWSDRLTAQPELVFTDLGFQINRSLRGVHVIGQGFLPGLLGGEFDFIFNFDTENVEKINGEGYVSVAGAQLAPWQSKLFSGAQGHLFDGEIDLAAWFTWSAGELRRADLNIEGRRVVVGATGHSDLHFDSLSVLAHWYREKNGWGLAINDFRLLQNGAAWLNVTHSGIRFQLLEQGARFELGVPALDIARVSALALRLPYLDEEWRTALLGMKPVATVNDLYVRWQQRGEGGEQYFARAEFTDLGGSRHKKIPAFSGVDGILSVANTGWSLNLKTNEARVRLAGLFRDPLNFTRLTGVISGEWGDEGWQVWSDGLAVSNTHLSASAYFTLQKQAGQGSPELDLVVSAERADVSQTSKYLPVGIMSKQVVAWLDRAIIDGQVTRAGVTFRGPIKKSFPFDRLDGRFEVQVAFEDGVIAYAPGWPPIVDAKGQLIFNEQSMRVRGHSAMTLDSKLTHVEVAIPKFKAKNRAVYINGYATGPTSNGLLFLTTTPLAKTVGRYFLNARGQGTSELELSLRIPLNEHETALTIKGVNTFHESDLLFEDIGVDVRNVDGVLTFTEKGVSAEHLRGEVLGLPVEAAMHTEVVDSVVRVVITGRGRASPQALSRQFKLAIFNDMEGDVPWSGRLVLPNEGNVELVVSSQLEGVAVNLPAPVGKSPSQSRALQVEMHLPFNEKNLLHFRYGEDMRGVFELAREEKAIVLKRGEIRFADGTAQLPIGSGLRLVVKADFYDHSQWMAYLSKQGQEGGSEDIAFVQLDLYFDEALLYGQLFREMSVEMVKVDRRWLGVIFGPDVAGHLSIPSDEKLPLVLELDYLHVRVDAVDAHADTEHEEKVDPSQVTALHLVVRELYRNNARLGRLVVELEPGFAGRGVKIKRVDLIGEYISVQGHGTWQAFPETHKQETRFEATVESKDMGVLLGLFGYTDNLDRGEAKNEVRLSWVGGPGDFALEKLDGELVFNIKSGALLDVNPGAGRIFGLLSVQALPRRLSLDFRDLFAKGLAFDEIKGTVKLSQGEAFTEDLRLKGPAVEVAVTGYIDLVGKKYNQYVTVEPNYTGTLPLAVAVIVNPVAGVAAWFAEKLLRRPVGDIARILYHVTGSWSSPNVKRLGRLDNARGESALPTSP